MALSIPAQDDAVVGDVNCYVWESENDATSASDCIEWNEGGTNVNAYYYVSDVVGTSYSGFDSTNWIYLQDVWQYLQHVRRVSAVLL